MIKIIWMILFTMVLTVSTIAVEGTFDQLQTAVNEGNVLQGIHYNLRGKTLVLNEGQKLIGQKNTVIYSDKYPDYFWPFIQVKPRTETVPINADAIVEKKPVLKIRFTNSVESKFSIGDKVVFEGHFNKSTLQSLFSEIIEISSDGTVVTMRDSLSFSINPPMVLQKLTDMRCQISDLSFEIKSSQQQTILDIRDYCRNVTVSNCLFTAKEESNKNIGVFVRHSIVNIVNCSLDGFGLYAIRCENSGYGSVQGCTIKKSNYSLTMFRVHNYIIHENSISSGKNLAYGRGLFISADDDDNHLTGDECCINSITNNKINNAVCGIAGSGLGGIHLHRKCNYNIISGNTSQHNGMGIYLETDNDYNQVVNNTCSYNNGDSTPGNVYGIGIELDYENDGNVIDQNECNYNNGLTGDSIANKNWYGMTGIGIEVRNGYGSGHDNLNNKITNNTCSFNGCIGLKVAGTGSRVSNNILVDNGQNSKYSLRNSVVLSGKDILFNNNSIIGGNVQMATLPYNYRTLDIDGVNITSAWNYISTGCFADSSVYIFNKAKNITSYQDTLVGCKEK